MQSEQKSPGDEERLVGTMGNNGNSSRQRSTSTRRTRGRSSTIEERPSKRISRAPPNSGSGSAADHNSNPPSATKENPNSKSSQGSNEITPGSNTGSIKRRSESLLAEDSEEEGDDERSAESGDDGMGMKDDDVSSKGVPPSVLRDATNPNTRDGENGGRARKGSESSLTDNSCGVNSERAVDGEPRICVGSVASVATIILDDMKAKVLTSQVSDWVFKRLKFVNDKTFEEDRLKVLERSANALGIKDEVKRKLIRDQLVAYWKQRIGRMRDYFINCVKDSVMKTMCKLLDWLC